MDAATAYTEAVARRYAAEAILSDAGARRNQAEVENRVYKGARASACFKAACLHYLFASRKAAAARREEDEAAAAVPDE